MRVKGCVNAPDLFSRSSKERDAVFKVDAFSSAAAVTALLLATGLLIAFAVNRKLTAFPWWAACFLLLAMSLATVTLRINVPPYLVKGFS
jgi:hypothetical protein